MTQTTTTTHELPEWVLMAKALRGELSEQEQKEFSEWLNANENNALLWAEAAETWEKTGSVYDANYAPDPNLAWENLCASFSFESSTPKQNYSFQKEPEAEIKPIFAWTQFMRYAAILLLAVGLGWVGYIQWDSSNNWTQIATLSGERKLIYLPDSSIVTLNANSSLRYHTSFSGESRNVELIGEGFFDVKENPSKPFIITSGQAATKVLGTSFNLKALNDSKEVSVTVITGKVSLSNTKTLEEVILTPGYTGSLQPSGRVTSNETTSESISSWRSLSFENTSLKEVSEQLTQFFGVSVALDNPSLENCSFTGTFENPDLKVIFKVLAASSDVMVKQLDPNTYTISGPGCR